MDKVLTIAGSDCSGGAGIQADLKTISAYKMYGMSVITALTVQNTLGVYDIQETRVDIVAKQIDAIFEDIRPDAIKIGMVSNIEIIKLIASKLKEYRASNIVVDPVMVSTSGAKLLHDDAIDALINELFILARLITPNIPEAEILCHFKINNNKDMEKAAKYIYDKYKCNVLIKGGHSISDACDLLIEDNKLTWIEAKRIANNNTHGTGCTLSSAIACGLARKDSLYESIKHAKEYISKCLEAQLDLGKGSGPLNHMV